MSKYKGPRLWKVLKDGKIIESTSPGKYAGNTTHKIFGRLSCKSGMSMRKENRVFFLNWNDAVKAGYRPCKNCKPTRSGERRKKILKKVEFEVKNDQYLVISYTMMGAGLGRVIVKNENKQVKILAETGPGGGTFEFSDDKTDPYECDYYLSNTNWTVSLSDIIKTKFWGQFTWGELAAKVKDRAFNNAVNREIRKLVEEFEQKAAETLNQKFRNGK